MVGRPLREYERLTDEPFAFAPLFYRGTGRRETGWRTSRLGHFRKGLEHALGLRSLERLVKDHEVDVVHFQWLMLPLLDRVALNRLRRQCGLVFTVHNAKIASHSSSAVVGKFGATLQSLGRIGAVLGFDRYIVHTANSFDRMTELGVNAERIVHLPHPPLVLAEPPRERIEQDTKTRDEILFFGNIKPYKGVDVLIEAGIALAATRRDFRITIAGRPFQSLEALRRKIVNAGAEDVFHFHLDFLSDAELAEYLTSASIVVFPYREIDGSGALSHAIRFEKPIVATNVGGFAESPFAEHIELVPPEDAISLASTLAGLLDEPARRCELARQTSKLWALLPSWRDYAVACRTAYSEIIRR
jgi:glycosyltransferase involved in cell wall biosynthesis